MRAVIVDDEPLARARLTRLLASEADVDLVGEFADGASAAQALPGLGAHVVFLDVQMPEVDGFGMLQALPPAERPLVVFVTAHAQHAVRAFDAQAADYLLKPVGPDRLHESVERVRRRRAGLSATPGAYPERLAVPDGQHLRVVPVSELECVRAQGNYVELCVGKRTLLLRETMANLEARLDPRLFLRVHRSHIVRLDLVDAVEACEGGGCLVRMRSGLRLAAGRSHRAALRRALGGEA
nr:MULTISPECIES: LytTR family DNA-binding domain-containing protein [Myxococcaceae]